MIKTQQVEENKVFWRSNYQYHSNSQRVSGWLASHRSFREDLCKLTAETYVLGCQNISDTNLQKKKENLAKVYKLFQDLKIRLESHAEFEDKHLFPAFEALEAPHLVQFPRELLSQQHILIHNVETVIENIVNKELAITARLPSWMVNDNNSVDGSDENDDVNAHEREKKEESYTFTIDSIRHALQEYQQLIIEHLLIEETSLIYPWLSLPDSLYLLFLHQVDNGVPPSTISSTKTTTASSSPSSLMELSVKDLKLRIWSFFNNTKSNRTTFSHSSRVELLGEMERAVEKKDLVNLLLKCENLCKQPQLQQQQQEQQQEKQQQQQQTLQREHQQERKRVNLTSTAPVVTTNANPNNNNNNNNNNNSNNSNKKKTVIKDRYGVDVDLMSGGCCFAGTDTCCKSSALRRLQHQY